MPWLQHPSFTIRKEIISQVTPQFVELAGSQERLEFDYLVLAMGVSRQAPIGVSASTKDEFIKDLERDHAAIASAKSIAIVGGGAVGTELAADLMTDFPEKDVTLVHSRDLPVPGPFMEEFRQGAADILRKLGVRTLFGQRVVNEIPADTCPEPEAPEFSDILPELVDSVKRNVTIETTSGEKIKADLVFNCLGAKTKAPIVDLPSSTDEPTFTPNGIRVKSSLQLDDPKYPNIFAVGDMCNRAHVKLAGAAVSGGRLAGENIARLITAGAEGGAVELIESRPPKVSMKLILGEKHALIQGKDHVVPSEEAIHKCAPDIKLGKAMRSNFIDTYPVAK
ncbi:hypothetical protein FBU59_004627 [Linderina macrospora]|uniref:Uncharacterized protein n=1 Tax=Linderina macrospora TaxID=4868 RepID=A0ACC1J565_9FUNG|nr:hypothetical protein FBU59_004627 [Linderina macrospora]